MTGSTARVLIIEDEAVLRSSMVRGLQRLPGLEVVHAGTLGEGLALVDQGPPRLVVSDIDLPDRSGLELIGELGRRRLTVPIVFISAYLKAYRSQIPPHANVEVLEKPVGIDELREVVRRHVAGGMPESTESNPFGVADYMQLSSLGRHSVVIEVSGGGRVVIVQGEVWSATDAGGEGLPALQRLVMAQGRVVSCQALTTEPGPRTLSGSAEELLLECARLADEGQGAAAPSPDSPPALGEASFTELALDEAPLAAPRPVEVAPPPVVATPAPQPPPVEPAPVTATPAPALRSAAAAFDELFERGVEAAFAKRYQEALDAFVAARALKPEDRRVEANIVRLKEILARLERDRA